MNILFTCAGRRTYLLKYFKENMAPGDQILATDMQLSAPALQAADIKIQVPAVYAEDYVHSSGIGSDILLDAIEIHVLSQLGTGIASLGGTLYVTHIRRTTCQTSHTTLLVEEVRHAVGIQTEFLLNESHGTAVDIAGTGTHDKTLQRRQTH